MKQCPNQSINKMDVTDDDGGGQQLQQPFNFNSIQVLSVSGSGGKQVYNTCPAMMTDVMVEGVAKVKFECDTAASHCIMSEGVYHSLQKQNWRIPNMKSEKLVVKLADGTISDKACGSVKLKVKAKNTEEVSLDFFVINGPNNLLGRSALMKLWPKEFNALNTVATAKAAVVQKWKAGIPGVGWSCTTSGNEANNSRCIPGVAEPCGTRAANETQNSRRIYCNSNNSMIPGVGQSRSTSAKEAGNSGRSELELSDASVSGLATAAVVALPEKQKLPPLSAGEMTQEVGERPQCSLKRVTWK